MQDGLHPNEKGHEVIMYELNQGLLPVFTTKRRQPMANGLITDLSTVFNDRWKIVAQHEYNYQACFRKL